MLAIAKEMNLSETAFVWKKPDGHFRARYFTPAEEIPLAGHPTIATVYALVDSGTTDPARRLSQDPARTARWAGRCGNLRPKRGSGQDRHVAAQTAIPVHASGLRT